mgnify:CR=1 FL=1
MLSVFDRLWFCHIFPAQLAQEQEKKMLELEMKEAKLRRTKELFYQKAFEEDMKQYKAEQMRRELTCDISRVQCRHSCP